MAKAAAPVRHKAIIRFTSLSADAEEALSLLLNNFRWDNCNSGGIIQCALKPYHNLNKKLNKFIIFFFLLYWLP